MTRTKKKPRNERPKKQPHAADGRGARPTDPNELAAWIVEQATGDAPDGGEDQGSSSSGNPTKDA